MYGGGVNFSKILCIMLRFCCDFSHVCTCSVASEICLDGCVCVCLGWGGAPVEGGCSGEAWLCQHKIREKKKNQKHAASVLWNAMSCQGSLVKQCEKGNTFSFHIFPQHHHNTSLCTSACLRKRKQVVVSELHFCSYAR